MQQMKTVNCPSDLPTTLFIGGIKNVEDPTFCTLGDIIERCRNPNDGGAASWARECADNGDDMFDDIKGTLPVALFSGRFSYRSNVSCMHYSPLIVIDLDDLEDPIEVRDMFQGDPHIVACFLSPSGRGCKPLIYTGANTIAEHKHAWASACNYLRTKYDIDPTSSKGQHDVARACYIGYDPRAWIADSMEPLPIDYSIPIAESRDKRQAHNGAELVTENRHEYLRAYTARLASIGLSENEITQAAKVLIEDRFVFEDHETRRIDDSEISRLVKGAVDKYQTVDKVAALAHGADVAQSLLDHYEKELDKGIVENPIRPMILRTHEDRYRDTLIPPPRLIDGLLPLGGIGAVIAQPGGGKTLWVVELCRAVAMGDALGHHSASKGKVVYICTDAPDDTERRMLSLPEEARKGIYTVTKAPRFPSGIEALLEALDTVSGVKLVVLDTWDSNRDHADGGYSGQDMLIEQAMSTMRDIARDRMLSIVVIHHSTRGDAQQARGSLVFDARCDWMATCEAEENSDIITVKTTKNRCGSCGIIGDWRIHANPHPDAPDEPTIPALEFLSVVEASAVKGHKKSIDAQNLLFAALNIFVENENGKVTYQKIQDELECPSRGKVQKIVKELRERDYVYETEMVVTECGKRAMKERMNLPQSQVG